MAYYSVLLHDTREDTLHVFKASSIASPPEDTSWSSVATYVLDGPIKSVWVSQESSDLHIAVAGIYNEHLGITHGFVKYLKFDPGTDSFVAVDAANNYYDERVDNSDAVLSGESNDGDRSVASIAVRSDGDLIFIYLDTNNDVNYSRKEAGSWTRGTTVYSTTDAQTCIVEMGASDRAHFFFVDTNDDLFHRSLDSANSLGTNTTTIDSAVSAHRHSIAGAVAFNDGTARVRVIYRDSTLRLSANYSNDTENWSGTAETDFSLPSTTTNESVNSDIALDGDDTWVLYSQGTYWDIFSDSNDGISGWGVDNEEKDEVTCQAISINKYDNAIAYVWDDGGTTKYSEVSLAPPPAMASLRLLRGVGR